VANPSAARKSWSHGSSMLLDHLVGPQQERLRDRKPERLGGLQVGHDWDGWQGVQQTGMLVRRSSAAGDGVPSTGVLR
jgi:hypothetical protein